jgi:hypothetical protein
VGYNCKFRKSWCYVHTSCSDPCIRWCLLIKSDVFFRQVLLCKYVVGTKNNFRCPLKLYQPWDKSKNGFHRRWNSLRNFVNVPSIIVGKEIWREGRNTEKFLATLHRKGFCARWLRTSFKIYGRWGIQIGFTIKSWTFLASWLYDVSRVSIKRF